MLSIVFDTETTGLRRRQEAVSRTSFRNVDEVIQIGGLVLDEDYKPNRAFCYYCDSIHPESSSNALAVHGISLSNIRQYIPNIFLEDVMSKHLTEFYEPDVLFVGYNIEFDTAMVSQTLYGTKAELSFPPKSVRLGVRKGRNCLDVMDFFQERNTLVSRTGMVMQELKEFYEEYCGRLPVDTNIPDLYEKSAVHAHNALYDAIATYVLFQKVVLPKFPRRRK